MAVNEELGATNSEEISLPLKKYATFFSWSWKDDLFIGAYGHHDRSSPLERNINFPSQGHIERVGRIIKYVSMNMYFGNHYVSKTF